MEVCGQSEEELADAESESAVLQLLLAWKNITTVLAAHKVQKM